MTRWEFGAAVALDLALGDPRWLPHPVRAIGWLSGTGERLIRRSRIPLRIGGVLLCFVVPAATAGAVYATLPYANIYWAFSFLALRSLDVEAMGVIRALEVGAPEVARERLSMIVGRDTEALDFREIVRAAVETVSENLGDGVIAPLFYLALLGPAGMAAYKAVNTLDSMVGYKNERYRELGWASAKLDDVLNFIPARIAALMVWCTAWVLGLDSANSVRVTFRDAHKQPSPNSGWPEAAFAGALGVRLGGANYYRGVASRKENLGDPHRGLAIDAFLDARRLLYVSSFLMMALVAVWL